MDTETKGLNEGEERRQLWRERLDRQGRSGKTISAYCAEEGVKPWQFFYWRRALQPKTRVAGGFVELSSLSPAGMVLELAGCRITVARGFDPELLRQVVSALRPG